MSTYEEVERVSYPVFCFSEEWSATLRPHKLTVMKRSTIDLIKERCDMNSREKLEGDEFFVMSITNQLQNAAKLQLQLPLAMDDLTREFMTAGTVKIFRLWMVLAVQMLVNIKGFLRSDMHRGFETLQAAGTRVTTTIKQHFQAAWELKVRKEKWYRDNDCQILKLVSFVGEWIKKDKVTNATRKHFRQLLEDMGVEMRRSYTASIIQCFVVPLSTSWTCHSKR